MHRGKPAHPRFCLTALRFPMLESIRHPQIIPKPGQRARQRHTIKPTLAASQPAGESFEWRHDLSPRPFNPPFQRGIRPQAQGLMPVIARPPVRQRLVLELIQCGFAYRHQAGLERSKPIVVLPAKGHRAHSVSDQLRQGVMRHRLAPIQKKWNPIPPEYAADHFVITLERSQQHPHLPIPPARFLPHMTQDLTGRKSRLPNRIRTNHAPHRGPRRLRRGFISKRVPMAGEPLDLGALTKPRRLSCLRQHDHLRHHTGNVRHPIPHRSERARHPRPGRHPPRFAFRKSGQTKRQGRPPGNGDHLDQQLEFLRG